MERMPQGIMVAVMVRVREEVGCTRDGSVRPKPGSASSDFLEIEKRAVYFHIRSE